MRSVWDEEQEKWYFSIVDVVSVLTDSADAQAKDPQTLAENMQCAADGGNVAKVAREELEAKTGRSVVSPLSAKRFFETQNVQEIEDKKKQD